MRMYLKNKSLPLLLGITMGAASLFSHAAGLQISPTSLSLPAKQRAGIFTLSNTGKEPLTAQVRVFRWEQDEKGENILTPSTAVVASPPMVKLSAGGVQQFRIIRTQPAGSAEEAYRLVVDELPAPEKKPKNGLQFVLRYSVPLFLNQTENPETQLQWQIQSAKNGKALLTVQNVGFAHAQLSNITFQTATEKNKLSLVNGLAGYVLPGKKWQTTLDVSPSALRKGTLSVTVNGQQTLPEVRFAGN
ncbi:molecular chaperone [Neisseria animaloris]|uniref:fimbrial biogenesis chaperone n=1 Tax=Neisseria animaloris TaxID=326522 RepID=UPI0039E0EA52